jgi:hypothetical protein
MFGMLILVLQEAVGARFKNCGGGVTNSAELLNRPDRN